MSRNRFVGTWRLVSAEHTDSDGKITYLHGKDPVGYIMYNDDGYMCVAIANSSRSNSVSDDRMSATSEEKIAAADTYMSYCGTYEIRDDRIIHHVKVSLFPNNVGKDQERIFQFDGDMLSLTTPPSLIGGARRVGHLVWKRV
jgi:hypothetical protein